MSKDLNELEELKNEYIEQINRRVNDKIMEENTANFIIKLMNKATDKVELENLAALATINKKTGFHFDLRLEKQTNTIKYFKKNNKLSFKQNDGKPINKLIIGDNYDALNNLLIEYKGKIDVIYIDPPYGADSMGEFAQTNYNNNITRDNLLSMLHRRLLLAKQLLSDEGVIFCSIDDKNQAYVKCLFDDVFEESNFCNTLFILDNLKGKTNDNYISSVGSKLIVYIKGKNEYNEIGFNEVENYFGETIEEKYKKEDEEGLFNSITFKKTGQSKLREDRPYMFYPILEKNKILYAISVTEYENIYNKTTNSFNDDYINKLKEKYKDFNFILPISSEGEFLRWTSGFNTFKLKINKDIYYDEGVKQKVRPSPQELLHLYANGTPKSFMYKPSYSNGTDNLKSVMSEVNVEYPKSVDFIKDLLKLIKNINAIILDFFAGSGTTGQATMELNKEDGGNRQFILCQMNEITDTTPNGIAYDVTAKRLKRVMTGECYDGNKEFEWIKHNEALGGSLDVYEIAEIEANRTTPNNTAFDVIDETLYGKEKITNKMEKVKWVCENFENTTNRIENDNDYMERVKRGGI